MFMIVSTILIVFAEPFTTGCIGIRRMGAGYSRLVKDIIGMARAISGFTRANATVTRKGR